MLKKNIAPHDCQGCQDEDLPVLEPVENPPAVVEQDDNTVSNSSHADGSKPIPKKLIDFLKKTQYRCKESQLNITIHTI